ncbi:carbohydrate sulfotransferase 11 [Tachypleus tridentatus]|uniref:carbohydrate sulfotransferase 11 n=1 Tax=Tachypleus tridentatus TaxID=6853 RepID=UPI003FD08596
MCRVLGQYLSKMLSLTKTKLFTIILVGFVCISTYLLMKTEPGRKKNLWLFQEKILPKVEQEQIQRHQNLIQICQKMGYNDTSLENINQDQLSHLIVDQNYKLIYCYVPKVACTNWKRILMVLKGNEVKKPLDILGNETHAHNFKTLNKVSIQEAWSMLKTYLKFLFVRHPYERLLSAYRNKFENRYSDYFTSRFGRKIIQRYRTNASQVSLKKGHDVTFEEFVQYISELDPVQKSTFNEHWRPIFDLCLPCSLNYKVIGKYETLKDDSDYVLWKAGLLQKIDFPQREQSYKMEPTAVLLKKYFNQISQDVKDKLYTIYQADFTIFGYKNPF